MLKERTWKPTGGRDLGKAFVIKEQPAIPLERWLERAALALSRGGQPFDPNMLKMGFAGWATLGIQLLQETQWSEISPLLDEMLYRCVKLVPDASRPNVVRDLQEDDLEDISTLKDLRREVIELHLGFSVADALLMLISMASAKMSTESSDTPISRSASET